MTAPLPDDQITQDDVERARLAWEKGAPAQYKKLLDTEADNGNGSAFQKSN